MQLEQSGFRIYKSFLTRIPSICLIIAAITCLVIMAINSLLISQSQLETPYARCWQKYYDTLHPNNTYFLEEMLKANKGNVSQRQLDNAYSLVNYTTLVKIQMSQLLQEGEGCLIEFDTSNKNTDTDASQQIISKKVQKNETLGYIVSVKPLLQFDISNQTFKTNHNFHVHTITLPKINPKYVYIGNKESASVAEEYVREMSEAFNIVNKKLIQQWKTTYQQVKQLEWVQVENEQGQKQVKIVKKQDTENSGQQNQGQGEQDNDEIQDDQQTKVEQNGENSQKTEITNRIDEKDMKLQNFAQKQSDQIQGKETKEKDISKDVRMGLDKTFKILLSINLLANHELLYRLDDNSRWSTVEYPTKGSIITKPFFFDKVFMFILTALNTVFISISAAMLVRYCYISILTLFALVGGQKIQKNIGWMHRYLSMTQSRNNNKKLKIQIGLAILTMHFLFAIAFYLLVKICQIIIKQYFIPHNNDYAATFINTIIIVETAHYVFFRSRSTLNFFHTFSFCISTLTLMYIGYNSYYATSYFLNLHRLLHFFLIFTFLFVEKLVADDEFQSQYKPSLEKPRMLFFFGYDMDWHRGVPPIWTLFISWYDLSFSSAKERAYLDQDYELLYGLLLGMDEPQELPQYQEEEQELNLGNESSMSENYA